MTRDKLTPRNCHRAAMVINTTGSHVNPIPFNFNGSIHRGYMTHTVGIAPDTENLHENDFEGWEVVSFSYKVNMDDLYDIAIRAYHHLSHNSRELGRSTILQYEQQLNDDLSRIPEDHHERYISNYKRYFSSWMAALSICYNTNIAGTSNFNSRQASKRSNTEDKRRNEFHQWRVKALKAIAKQVKANRTLEEKIADDWKPLKNSIDHTAWTIYQINTGQDEISEKSHYVSLMYSKVGTFAKNGNVEIVRKAIEHVREWNKKTSVITERHKFFKLLDVANEVRNARNITSRNTMREERCEEAGVTILFNTEEDRLQLFYDQKPDKEQCKTLHSYGFHFSWKNSAWQRKITVNAEIATERLLGIKLTQS